MLQFSWLKLPPPPTSPPGRIGGGGTGRNLIIAANIFFPCSQVRRRDTGHIISFPLILISCLFDPSQILYNLHWKTFLLGKEQAQAALLLTIRLVSRLPDPSLLSRVPLTRAPWYRCHNSSSTNKPSEAQASPNKTPQDVVTQKNDSRRSDLCHCFFVDLRPGDGHFRHPLKFFCSQKAANSVVFCIPIQACFPLLCAETSAPGHQVRHVNIPSKISVIAPWLQVFRDQYETFIRCQEQHYLQEVYKGFFCGLRSGQFVFLTIPLHDNGKISNALHYDRTGASMLIISRYLISM